MPSGFKNDAIGVWYDAKSSVTQQISKIKQFVQEKGVSIMAQAIQPKNSATDASGGPNMGKEDYSRLIQRFEEDMVNLKKNAKDYSNSVAKLRQALMNHDDVIKREQSTLFADHKELLNSITTYNDILMGRANLHEQVQSQENQASSLQRTQGQGSRPASNGGGLVMSPFEKKVNAYQRSALNRSNSRGPQTQQAVGQKPPKLQQ